jgi:hypothetical protein
MSYLSGSNLAFAKMFHQSLITETLGCDAGKTVQPKFRVDDGVSMTDLTSPIVANGTTGTLLTNAVEGNKVQFELDLATDDSAVSPQVLFLQATGIERPEVIRVHHATYTAGTDPNSSVITLRNLLRTARTTTSLIKWADLRYTPPGTGGSGYSFVVIEPGYPKEIEVFKGKDKPPELGLEIAWREVDNVTVNNFLNGGSSSSVFSGIIDGGTP